MTQNINKLTTFSPAVWPDRSKEGEKASEDYQARLAQQAAEQVQQDNPVVEVQPTYNGTCSDWMAMAAISDIANAYRLVMRESGCNPNSVNASSGACGIGQQLPCGKWPRQWNDPVGALIDMQQYVYERYGSWANAWAHECNYGWY